MFVYGIKSSTTYYKMLYMLQNAIVRHNVTQSFLQLHLNNKNVSSMKSISIYQTISNNSSPHNGFNVLSYEDQFGLCPLLNRQRDLFADFGNKVSTCSDFIELEIDDVNLFDIE